MVLLPPDQTLCSAVVSQNQHERVPSSIYGLIPSVVSSRIPVLTSIRQSARNAVSRPKLSPNATATKKNTKNWSTVKQRQDSLGSATTVESDVSLLPSRASTPELGEQRSVLAETQMVSANTDTGGVDWEVASVGIKLWLCASAQVRLGAGDPATMRAMHIDALRYMNMALPPDLSATEIDIVRASIHPQLRQDDVIYSNTTQRPNALRQGIAQAVYWTIALIFVVTPLLIGALNRLLVYERERKLMERALSNSISLTRALGERGLNFGDAMVRFKATPLGAVLLGAMLWIVDGVAGGVNDGLIRSTTGQAAFYD